jgi:predicted HicB family RNase H-like nuclease
MCRISKSKLAAKTKVEAIKGITQLVSDVVSDMESSNETIPVPLSTKNYSGNLSIRIPPEVHTENLPSRQPNQISV